MQAVVLAAGESSRFYPFNNRHKTEIVLLGKPIIAHTLESLIKAKIDNVVIVVSKNSKIPELLKEYKDKLKITFVMQENPTGASDSLILSEEFLEEQFFLVNGSHVDFHEFSDLMLTKKDADIVLLSKEESNASQYGILKVTDDLVLDIVEKPKDNIEKSNLRVIGIYLFKKNILDVVKKLPEEHFRLEKAIAQKAQEKTVKFVKTERELLTLKYVWDLFKIKDYLLGNLLNYISKTAEIHKSVIIEGNVYIEDGVKILENVVIKGPVFIGKNALIGNNSLIRNKSIIDENTVVGSYLELKNTILMEGSTTHTGVIEDSIIGRNCKIAAGILTANVRLDRGNITSIIKEEKINTFRNFFGVLIGDNCATGIKTTTMPGIIIGRNCLIGPSTIVMKNVPNDSKYYTSFNEVIEKK